MAAFTFAVLTDTHIRAPEGDLSSPFPVNERANDRARYAVSLIAREKPEIAFHLGDMIHPLPGTPAYDAAAKEAGRILAPLTKLHVVPGNHDIGDKPSPGMPAKSATDATMRQFAEAFGPDHWMVRHKGAAFVGVNASLVNSGLEREARQREWLERVLGAAKDERVFLLSHYPPFICDAGEQDHYDNYAEPGRSWLLDLAADTGVEAIFSGHVHHFFYNRHRGVKLICLPPTSFTRQDYAEMFSVAPAPEFGRDDRGKFGVALVDVEDDEFRLRWVDTGGREQAEDAAFDPVGSIPRLPVIPHLRHDWFRAVSLPYNGPMEEFTRKRVRNDYPLLRVLQLGIAAVRTPLRDLVDAEGRRRIEDWRALGLRFVFFRAGLPTSGELDALTATGPGCRALEILSTEADVSDIIGELPKMMDGVECPVWLGKVATSADDTRPDAVFAHKVSSGFLPEQVSGALAALGPLRPQGLVVQLPWEEDPGRTIRSLSSELNAMGVALVVNLRLAPTNPAHSNFDEAAIGNRIRTALEAASSCSEAHVQVDTFEDVDRGYSPRYGLIDRLGNLRSAVIGEEPF